MTRTTLAVVASLITSTFGVQFDYDKYDQESFNTSSYFKNIKASYYHSGDNTGKAMLAFKNEAITWEWKDSVCSSVSQYFTDGVGEYQFSGTYKCSFKPKDVMNVAELFFMGDGAEGFKKKYGAKIDVPEGIVAERVTPLTNIEKLGLKLAVKVVYNKRDYLGTVGGQAVYDTGEILTYVEGTLKTKVLVADIERWTAVCTATEKGKKIYYNLRFDVEKSDASFGLQQRISVSKVEYNRDYKKSPYGE